MPSRLSNLPITLRAEAFGGILFDPGSDATLLHLDHEAFRVARLMADGKHRFLDPAKRNLAAQLVRDTRLGTDCEVRNVDLPHAAEPRDTPPSLCAPTLVDFQITNRCRMGCPHCYAASGPDGAHATWEDVATVVRRSHEAGVCQLALGGGEPLLHPDIIDLLHLCCDNGIVPNMTTGGMDFTDENLRALRECCGAVGLSLEAVGKAYNRVRGKLGFEGFKDALSRMRDWEIPTVLQIVLSEANFDDLPELVDFCLEQSPLYGVIFLAYKPVGRGETFTKPLSALDPARVSQGLGDAFQRLAPHTRVGYDCCATPAVAGVQKHLGFADISHLEGCSGMRGSCGVLPNLDVIPCTFTPTHIMGNLREQSLDAIFAAPPARGFRDRIARRADKTPLCADCPLRAHCWAGCPVMDLATCA